MKAVSIIFFILGSFERPNSNNLLADSKVK